MAAGASAAVFALVRGCLVVTPLGDLDAGGIRTLQSDLAGWLQRERVRGIVLDLSALEVLDEGDFSWVRQTLQVADLMGREAVLAALRPEAAATLVRLDVDVEGVRAALSVEDAIELLQGGA